MSCQHCVASIRDRLSSLSVLLARIRGGPDGRGLSPPDNVPVVLYEASKRISGLAASSYDDEGFSYDFGAHFVTNRLAAAIGIGDR
jgi:hypothetical protein